MDAAVFGRQIKDAQIPGTKEAGHGRERMAATLLGLKDLS